MYTVYAGCIILLCRGVTEKHCVDLTSVDPRDASIHLNRHIHYIHIHTYIHTYIQIGTYTQTYTHAHKHTCTHTQKTYTHAHTDIHTHMHTLVVVQPTAGGLQLLAALPRHHHPCYWGKMESGDGKVDEVGANSVTVLTQV